MVLNKQVILRILSVIIILFLLVLIFLWFYYKRTETKHVDDLDVVSQSKNVSGRLIGAKKTSNDLPIQDNVGRQDGRDISENGELSITNTAILIASKMGSYSTDTFNFVNLRDLSNLMTDKMIDHIDDLINRLSDISDAGDYYGVTTKALSVDVINPDKIELGIVDVIVSCQRIEVMGKDNPVQKTKYQKLKIKLLKQGDKWLVDEAEWI